MCLFSSSSSSGARAPYSKEGEGGEVEREGTGVYHDVYHVNGIDIKLKKLKK